MEKSSKHTLISVRRTMTEPKTAFAGGTHEVFTGFRDSMAAFNAEVAPSRLFGCWDSVFMVETGGSGERTVWREGCEEDPEP